MFTKHQPVFYFLPALLLCLFFTVPFYGSAQSLDTNRRIVDTTQNQSRHVIFENYSMEDTIHAQEVISGHTTDSILTKKHNPKIAIALSAVIPGAGQIYNKKWWKMPIIYAGLATSSYLVYRFATRMNIYKKEYRCRMQEGYGIPSPELANYSDDNILTTKKYYQRNMELSIAATAIIYLLNIVDAAVDAHLFYFDISEDLSLQITPQIQPRNYLENESYGVTLALRWK